MESRFNTPPIQWYLYPMSRELRERIEHTFRTTADFDAFLIDHYPDLAKRISPSVDLVERVNLFLKLLDQNQVAHAAHLLNLERHGRHWGFGEQDGRWDRIERACRRQLLRMHDGSAKEKPRLRRRFADSIGPFLEAGYQQEGRQIQYAVVLAHEELTADWLRLFHSAMDERGLLSGSVRPCEVLLRGSRPKAPERKLAEQLGLRLRSLDDFENLIDLRAHVERQTEKLSRDKNYPPSLYVPQRMQVSEGASFRFDRTTDQALETVREWLQDLSRPRFVLLLGDFGVGKTFLLRELTRTLGQQGKPPWPLFLELRQLEKANALRPLLASYLAQPEHSETIPVTDVEALLTMLSLGRVVLFFDGFDELALRVSYQRATQHLETLLQSVASPETLAKVVVTSRTQHFLSLGDLEKGVTAARKTVLAERLNSVAISIGRLLPFEETQIQTFLLHRLGSEEAAAARMDLIRDIKDLLGLSHNPRMLSFIAELPDADLRQAKAREGTITAAKLYELLVQRWLHFEVNRADDRVPEPGLTYEQRMAAVTTIALHLWGQTERGVALDALGSAVQGFLHDHECAQHQLGSGTLLKSDDVGRFSFLHESVLEWFVARAAQAEVLEGRADLLGRHNLSPLMAEFVWGLAGKESTAAWSERVLLALEDDLGERSGVLKNNALTLLKRLGRTAPVRQNLAGQDLRGRDFSGQSLVGANLKGTRLDEATLTGADLRRANLNGASLKRAKLDRSDLTKADLCGADLTGASLIGATLLGVRLDEHTKLRRARLVGTQFDEGALERLPPASLWGAGMSLSELRPGFVTGRVHTAAWHPTERLCAIAQGHSVSIWDYELRTIVAVLRGHEKDVTTLAFSPDGLLLATGSDDNTVRIWDLSSGLERFILCGHEEFVVSVQFCPNSHLVASASWDKTARIWDTRTGTAKLVLSGHKSSVNCISFSPNGKHVATGSSDKTVKLWSTASGQVETSFHGHLREVTCVGFSKTGESLATGSADSTIRLWSVRHRRQIQVMSGHEREVTGLAFLPDGQSLVSSSWDKTIRLWRIPVDDSPRVIYAHTRELVGLHLKQDGGAMVCVSPIGVIVLENNDYFWRDTGIFSPAGHITEATSVSFSPDGSYFAATYSKQRARVWWTDSCRLKTILADESGRPESDLCSIKFSPDGSTIAAASSDATVKVWNISESSKPRILNGHTQAVTCLSFHPNGEILVAASRSGAILKWNLFSGQELLSPVDNEHSISAVSFSPGGGLLAYSSSDSSIKLISTDESNLVLRGHQLPVKSLSFSPDGKFIASSSADKSIRLWDISKGHEVRIFNGHWRQVNSIVFTKSGQAIASASEDKMVRLWDIHANQKQIILQGHEASVQCVCIDPDDQMLATASSDGTLRLWSIAGHHCVATVLASDSGWVVWCPDGRYKTGGELSNPSPFFHCIGLCRFEPGELDAYMSGLRLCPDQSMFDLPEWLYRTSPSFQPAIRDEQTLTKASPTSGAESAPLTVQISRGNTTLVAAARRHHLTWSSIETRFLASAVSSAIALFGYLILATQHELPLAAFIVLLGAIAGWALSKR